MTDVSAIQRSTKTILDSALKVLSANWDGDVVGQLYDQSEDLAELAQEAGFDDLSESLLGFAAYISSFAYSTLVPRLPQLQQIRALAESVAESLQRMRASVVVSDLSPETGVIAPPKAEVLFVGPPSTDIDALSKELTEAGLCWQASEIAEAAMAAYDPDRTRALVLYAEAVPSWLKAVELRQEAINMPTIAVSNREDLGLRLRAIRAGAEAFFLLPLDARAVAKRIQDLIRDRDDPYRVLIIDDDMSMTLFCDSVLRHNGMLTRCVNDPVKALTSLHEFQPDVILVDLYMPDISGLELLAVFRAHPRTLVTPVILLSGDEDAERRFDTLLTGGDDYLTKPIRPRHLVAAVTSRAKRSRWLKRELGAS